MTPELQSESAMERALSDAGELRALIGHVLQQNVEDMLAEEWEEWEQEILFGNPAAPPVPWQRIAWHPDDLLAPPPCHFRRWEQWLDLHYRAVVEAAIKGAGS